MLNSNTAEPMDANLQNWNNFRQHHAIGDWHGIWTRHFLEGKASQSFKGIRSFSVSADGNEIKHQNHFIYADGKTESKVVGLYPKPHTTLSLLGKSFPVLFLDNSYSWGATELGADSPFGFEIGFRYEDRRASAAVLYNRASEVNQVTIVSEHLGNLVEESATSSVSELSKINWVGRSKSILPDLTTTSPVSTEFYQLENLGEKYFTLYFNDGISISCPQKLEREKEFSLAVDWLIHPGLLQRGIRYFNSSGFTCFTLAVFSQNS